MFKRLEKFACRLFVRRYENLLYEHIQVVGIAKLSNLLLRQRRQCGEAELDHVDDLAALRLAKRNNSDHLSLSKTVPPFIYYPPYYLLILSGR